MQRVVLSILFLLGICLAQNGTSTDNVVTVDPIDTGDTTWMLASTALVFLMTPGLAMYYGGMVSQENVINTHMMSWFAIGVVGLQWVLVGYSFAFGPGTPGYGNGDWVVLRGVGLEPNTDYGATIPHLLYMFYQMTFAIITAALISGAVVERIKFSSFVIFILIWTTVVYDLVAHWVWSAWTVIEDGQPVQHFGWLRALGALDFAGGTVVHMTSGFSALAASIIVGKRRVYNKETSHTVTPHNVPMILQGAALLWFGWFGFNGGSAVASGRLATVAFTNTQIATFSAMLAWCFYEASLNRFSSFTATGAATGAVVGLVVITPCAGFVEPIMCIPIGIIGAGCSFAALQVKRRIYIADDTLDAFSGHGVGGTAGALLLGFFATKDVNAAGNNGVFYGNPILLAYQLAGVCATAAVAFGFTSIILLVMKYTIGLRIPDVNQEVVGMDKISHNEVAYNFEKLHIKDVELANGYAFSEDQTSDSQSKLEVEDPANKQKSQRTLSSWFNWKK